MPILLAAFASFISSPEVVPLLRTVTGVDDIALADTHASRHQPGHLLTTHGHSIFTHDDRFNAQHRRAA